MLRGGALAGLTGVGCLMAVAAHAAKSPFGIATPDGSGGGFGGPLGPIYAWVAIHQKGFYDGLTAALTSLREDTAGVWLLFGLSFAYGVFHAVGPGHGKAVITSYLMSTGDSARRGVALSFLSAFVQAGSAIAVVAIGTILLRVTAMTMTAATDRIEIASYAAITLFGAWLLLAKIRGGHHHHHHHSEAAPAAAHARGHGHDDDPDDHCDDHPHGAHDHHGGHQEEPSKARPRAPSIIRAWSAVLSVGIRPCSGAIIILVFAWSQGLFAAGIAATFVMALGTGLTVAALATLAVSAKGLVLRVANAGSGGAMALRLARGVEIAGAAAVLLLGLFLLGGALASSGVFATASQL